MLILECFREVGSRKHSPPSFKPGYIWASFGLSKRRTCWAFLLEHSSELFVLVRSTMDIGIGGYICFSGS